MINQIDNRVHVTDNVATKEITYFCSALHKTVEKKRYQDVVLDFSQCGTVFESFMVPAICAIRYYKNKFPVDFYIQLPEDKKMASLFHNSNWQNLLRPEEYEESSYKGTDHLPAMVFDDDRPAEQAVDRVLEMVFASTVNLEKRSLAALEWSLGEIVDNVTNHAESPVGGVIKASTFSDRQTVEFVVADAGIGIPCSLGVTDHKQAIVEAIQEGRTKDKQTNAGNGLYGTYQLASKSGGRLEIYSFFGSLLFSDKLQTFSNPAPYVGTCVICQISCADNEILKKALVFGDQVHEPAYDFVERKYEGDNENEYLFRMSDEAYAVTSRKAAEPVRRKMEQLLRDTPSAVLRVDFSDVYVITSSFADEVFGKLFIEIGPMNFLRRIRFENIDLTVQGLIDRAIIQRTASSNGSSRKVPGDT